MCGKLAILGRRGARRGAWRAARRLATVIHEEELILNVSLDSAADRIHIALPAMGHPLSLKLPSRSTAEVERYRIRWIAGAGIGELEPVLITVSLSSEKYGTSVKVRGAAGDHRSARMSVDRLTGVLADLFDVWDVVDILD